MKNTIYLFVILTITACNNMGKQRNNNQVREAKQVSADSTEDVKYSDQQLETFLDSIGKLPNKFLADKESFQADSVFKNQLSFDTLISVKDLAVLKNAIRKGFISINIARRIFNNPKIDGSCTEKSMDLTYKQGLTPVEYYPFGKDKKAFDEYGICIGEPGNCPNACLYFFKGNKIISMHNFYDRFASESLMHYKDDDGRTVVYYIYEFAEGSGVGWFNYFFYKYDGDKLIPVLNELQNGNFVEARPRALWLESTVKTTNPLTIKMVYNDDFSEPNNASDSAPPVINDSTMVKYIWDEKAKIFRGQYQQSKLTKSQILSYYLSNNNLLFINAHYEILKKTLLDKTKRARVLHYLQKVKSGNYWDD